MAIKWHKGQSYGCPVLTLTQKDRGVLKVVREAFGGRLYWANKARTCSFLKFSGSNAVALAKLLIPHSICKRPQLEMIVAADDLRSKDRAVIAGKLSELKQAVDLSE